MKKIKGLLIFGFFTLFGLGVSFGDKIYSTSIIRTSIFTSNNADVKFIESKNYYNPASFEYVNRNQNCRSIFNYHGFGIYSSFSNFEFNFNSGLNNYYYLILSGDSYISSQYNLNGCSSSITKDPIFSDMSFFTFGYTNSIFNGTVSYNSKLTRFTSSSVSDGLFAGTLQWNSTSSSNSSVSTNGKYVHLYYEPGVSNFSYNPGEINSSFPIEHYLYFDSNYIYSDYGNKRDIPEGFIRAKLFENLYSTYSSIAYDTSNSGLVFYSSYGPLQWSYNESNSSYNIYPSLSSGYLLLNFIDYESDTLTGNSTIVLSLSGDSIIYNYYNSYSPFIQQLDLNNPISRGVLTYDGSSLSAYNRLVAFVFDSNGFYFDSFGSFQNGLTLRTYHRSSATSMYADYTFTFESDDSIPVIIPGGGNGGNGNEFFPDPIFDGGVFDANTFLIEESIKCYLTSGEVCNSPFTLESSTNYVNNYDHEERVWNTETKTGYLTFNNSVDMLSQYCLNVNTIQYSFCSQLYLYEGYPITYYYNNGYFNYIISGSGWQVNLGSLWSGQLGYAYCEGSYCSNFNEGLPQFIRKDTGVYSDYGFSGEYVSLDFFKNYFENGFFFQCPFSYSGSYFTIGGKLVDRLDKHDPLKPINCMIAGFSYGVKSKFFGDSKLGLSHSGTLMSNTGPNATRFYTFLDIVLSLGYIFIFSKLFKFLKKH